MMGWSDFSNEELERRRLKSGEARKALDRAEFDHSYQQICDSEYWKFGPRCSGCDYWSSYGGYYGHCQHGGFVSGVEVIRSMGLSGYTGPIPPPGYPTTKSDHLCANFKDDFEWQTLEPEYLNTIGALENGLLRNKPKVIRPTPPAITSPKDQPHD